MLHNLSALVRYRGLIQTLVARDLKARYRGSVLGFFWSFINPLLLLLIYSFVFTTVLPRADSMGLEPYALFMFCGILPWTWFSSSILESSNVLISNGNLIKKVLFPAEVLPIVTVLANMVHFFLGLPILAAFLIYYQRPLDPLELLWFPAIVFVQFVLLLGLSLFAAALTVHFRDLKDILGNLLTLWFFATPIIYPMSEAPEKYPLAAEPESDDAPGDLVSGGAVLHRSARALALADGAARRVGRSIPRRLFRVRSSARLVCGRSLMNAAIDVTNVSKIYRRYARKKQFATLKSALLKGSLIRDLQPDETFPALRGVSFSVPKGCTYGIIGQNGSGKSTLLKCVAGITRPNEGTVKVDGRISALIELGAGFHPGDLRS